MLFIYKLPVMVNKDFHNFIPTETSCHLSSAGRQGWNLEVASRMVDPSNSQSCWKIVAQ